MIPLQISSLKKSYGSRQVVDIDQIELVPGELLALLGPSGCGKSTTLRLIAGLERPSDGDISIADRVVSSERVNVPPQQRNVGLVFQDYALFPHLNVARNVAYGLPRGSGRAARVADMLSLVGLADSGEKYPRELSGGQQQRVALARALAPQPDLLLLDEPFSSLDPGLRQQLRAEVRAILQQAGTTALLVTHDQEEALSVADRVAVMLKGRIVQVSAPEQLYYAPVTPEVALFIGDANLMEGTANAEGVATPLGLLHRPTHHRGPVQVMLRPELIGLSPEPVADAVEGVVEGIDFFGHDYVAKVRIGGLGESIQVRLLRFVILKPGQKVWLTLSGAGMVYPPAALPVQADSPVVG